VSSAATGLLQVIAATWLMFFSALIGNSSNSSIKFRKQLRKFGRLHSKAPFAPCGVLSGDADGNGAFRCVSSMNFSLTSDFSPSAAL